MVGGAGLGIAQAAFNNFMGERSAEKAYERQLDFWNIQNAYNTPLQQRKRLEAAGLNPASAAGQVAGSNVAGNLSSVQQNPAASSDLLDLQSTFNLFGQMEQLQAGNDLTRAQIQLTFAKTLVENAEAFGIDLSNEEKQKLLKWVDQKQELGIEKLIAEIGNIEADTGLKQEQTETEDTKQDLNQSQISLNVSLSDKALAEANHVRLTDSLVEAEAKYKDALTRLASAQTVQSLEESTLTSLNGIYRSIEIQLEKMFGAKWYEERIENMDADTRNKVGDIMLQLDEHLLNIRRAALFESEIEYNESATALNGTQAYFNQLQADNYSWWHGDGLLGAVGGLLHDAFGSLVGLAGAGVAGAAKVKAAQISAGK